MGTRRLAVSSAAVMLALASGCACNEGKPPVAGPAPTGRAFPPIPRIYGDGSSVTGTILEVDTEGTIRTNIPCNWMAAFPDTKHPFVDKPWGPPEGQYLRIILG